MADIRNIQCNPNVHKRLGIVARQTDLTMFEITNTAMDLYLSQLEQNIREVEAVEVQRQEVKDRFEAEMGKWLREYRDEHHKFPTGAVMKQWRVEWWAQHGGEQNGKTTNEL